VARNSRDCPKYEEIRNWILDNRGILKKIAEKVQPPVSDKFVQQVAYGVTITRPSHPVLRELKAVGWPGLK
jgi:hypothetical protein